MQRKSAVSRKKRVRQFCCPDRGMRSHFGAQSMTKARAKSGRDNRGKKR